MQVRNKIKKHKCYYILDTSGKSYRCEDCRKDLGKEKARELLDRRKLKIIGETAYRLKEV